MLRGDVPRTGERCPWLAGRAARAPSSASRGAARAHGALLTRSLAAPLAQGALLRPRSVVAAVAASVVELVATSNDNLLVPLAAAAPWLALL